MPDLSAVANMTSIEAISVVFAALMVWMAALVQHFSNVTVRGLQYAMSDRSVPPTLEGFFGRATRTLANNIESALMWAPPSVVIILLHRESWATQLSAVTYIATRAVFALSYWFNISVVRSLAWFVGMICCAAAAVLAVVPLS